MLSLPLCVVILTVVASALASPQQYTTKYDNIDIDQILNNDRLLDTYFKCLIDKGPCTPEGTELKKHIKEALENECKKCSEEQKKKTEKTLLFLHKNKPDLASQLEKKYDPNGVFVKRFRDEAAKRGIKI